MSKVPQRDEILKGKEMNFITTRPVCGEKCELSGDFRCEKCGYEFKVSEKTKMFMRIFNKIDEENNANHNDR